MSSRGGDGGHGGDVGVAADLARPPPSVGPLPSLPEGVVTAGGSTGGRARGSGSHPLGASPARHTSAAASALASNSVRPLLSVSSTGAVVASVHA